MNARTAKLCASLDMVALGCVLGVALLHPGQTSGNAVSCGLGPPPDAPGFAEARAQRAREAKSNGYELVCDADLERFHISFSPFALSLARLAFEPVDLSRTPFARLLSLGAMTEFDNRSRSRVYRGFRTDDGHTITLFEEDMSVDGINAYRAPEDEPERINGMPARLGVFQAPSGAAVSHLSWTERRRSYELWIDANVAGTPLRRTLFDLAASLPRAVPACPNEVPPKPLRLDAHGLPVIEPMPEFLTDAQMEAMADKSKRPCK